MARYPEGARNNMLPLVTTPAPDTATVMLVDTYGLVYRAFYALPALTTTRGVPINAVYGFTMMLTKIIGDEKPTHVIAAFDAGMPQARVEMFADYKAHREETPSDLRGQFALVRKVLATYKIPILEIEGQEADDVIATLARQAEEAHQRVLVVTGDLDLLQVVDERTTVLMTRRGITDLARYDEAAVRARFELEPSQLADYRGLKGDPSDNLPGIPGVGEKTAIKLIKAAGTLDTLLANPKLAGSPKLEKLVEEYGKQARTCRDVSVMSRDLPIELPWDAAVYTPPSNDELYVLYRELEFKSLLAKLEAPKEAVPVPSGETIEGSYESFVASTDPPDFRRLAALLNAAAGSKRIALVEHGDELAFSTADGSGVAFRKAALAVPEVGKAFDALWQGAGQLIMHDAKALFASLGRAPRPIADDTMVASHLINPARAYTNLADAVSEHLQKELPEETAAWADAVSQLAHHARHELGEREQISLYDDVEVPLVGVLAKMEAAGVALDPSALTDLSAEIDVAIARLQQDIYDLAGETFNIGSPQQLGRILFERMQLPGGKQTKTGWATGVEVLQTLAHEYPICAKVIDYREVTKLKNTYVDVLPSLVASDGRVHTIFNQTATATGRLSSTNPNLQNIPVRSDLGRQIRRAFVAPSKDSILLAADYSQIELRLMAHLSGDEAMRNAFLEGQDIHDFTARQIFGIGPIADVSGNERRMAKAVNFGLFYGMSDFGLAQRLEISRADAKTIMTQYFARFPTVRAWIERNLEEGRERGYVSTILGRRRYMPDLRAKNYMLRAAAEREATNAPLQGSASDLMKLAMVKIDRALAHTKLDAVMTLQIHDELIFEVPKKNLKSLASVVKSEMEGALELSVPVEVTLKSGRNWYEVENLDIDT